MTLVAQYHRLGGPQVLTVEEVPEQVPGPGQVLVWILAAGLNPFDEKVMSGMIPSEKPFPRRVGSDMAGTVEAVGPDATYWDGTAVQVGDAVMGRAAGSLAQTAIANSSSIIPIPEGLPTDVAGGLDIAGLTALSCLVTVPVGPGDTLLVNGATGAVGLLVCQLAIAGGATVIGSASPRNHAYLESIGVIPVGYGPKMEEAVRAAGHVTAVIDCHGRAGLDLGVTLGVPAERMTAIAGYDALSELGIQNVDRTARTAKNLSALADRVANGEISLPVAARYPLDQVADAFRALGASHAPGKIIVEPNQG